MIFTQAAPAATWSRITATSSPGADRSVHAGEVPARRGEEAAGGGHDRAPRRGAAREAEGDLGDAPGVPDHGHPAGRVLVKPRGAVLAVGQVRPLLVGGDGRVRVRVDEPGEREPAGQLLGLARPGGDAVARGAVEERPGECPCHGGTVQNRGTRGPRRSPPAGNPPRAAVAVHAERAAAGA